MWYTIVWTHTGSVSVETMAPHPGDQYVIDVVANSTSITGGVLYANTHPTVPIEKGTSQGCVQQRPLLEVTKVDGQISIKKF